MWLERFVIVVISLARDCAVRLGPLLPHRLGLGYVYRDHGYVRYPPSSSSSASSRRSRSPKCANWWRRRLRKRNNATPSGHLRRNRRVRHSGRAIDAVEKVRAEGYHQFEAYAPFPVEGLSEAMGLKRNLVPLIFPYSNPTQWENILDEVKNFPDSKSHPWSRINRNKG